MEWVDAVLKLSTALDKAIKAGDATELERVKGEQARLMALREAGLK